MASSSSGRMLYNANDTEGLTHDEIWDDTLLIQQYDETMARVRQKLHQRLSATNTEESEQSEAVHKAKDSASDYKNVQNSHLKKKKKKKTKKKYDWHTGDICRAKYSEDGVFYEGTIIGMNAAAGVCTVRFVGYNNEEEMQLSGLLKSKGDAARRKQMELANDGLSEQSDLCSSVVESDIQSDTDAEHSSKRRRTPHMPRPPRMPPPNFMSGGHSTPPPHLPRLPPPPVLTTDLSSDPQTSEALHTMLMSWYMTGYHTGYFQGLRQGRSAKR